MKTIFYILICISISYLFLSCETQPPLRPSYSSYYTAEQLCEMRERNRKEAEAYLQKLENSHPDSITMILFDASFVDSFPDFSRFNKAWLVSFSGIETRTIDQSLFSSDSLETVILDKCSFRKIDFPENNHIERLNLTNCGLNHIPSGIRRCKHLKALNLEGNNIRHIPRWIMELDSLEEISLNYNPLKLNRADVRHLSKVKQIIIGGCGLERLPSNIGRLHCESLNLAKNNLHTLPRSFSDLKHLNCLIFYENKFEEIPEVLADFTELRHLDFYKNNIKEIPDFVGNMENLQQLFLSFNRIKEIPDTLRNLKQLRYFYIHHNELHFLPEWITEMNSLERFGIGFNLLLELPDLSKMNSLKDFDCEHNLLEHIPWELLEKPDMEMINLRDNDFNLTDEEMMQLIKASNNVNLIY